MIYLIDSNIFIQAHRRYYPFDVMPSFWDAIQQAASDERIFSIDKVSVELIDNARDGDELKNYCKEVLPSSFFLNSEECISQYQELLVWAATNERGFTANAISKFMATEYADPWLVAYAIANNDITIVTEEKEDSRIKKDIPIPEVCKVFGVEWIDTIELLRRLEISV